MAGTIKVKNVQLGDNVTATQNFVWSENSDGTAKLARGNVGATTQDILTVDANGRIAMPQNVVAFSAGQTTLQNIGGGATVKLNFQTEDFDTNNNYDPVLSRFTPTVAGYYQIGGGFQITTVTTILRLFIYKNGVVNKHLVVSTAGCDWIYGSAFVYLNGTTDYVELFGYNLDANNTNPNPIATYFQGILIAKA